MLTSILTTVKKLIGPEETDENFDVDIIIHINSAFRTLLDLGVGPPTGFSIQDKTKTWGDYLGTDVSLFEDVKTYIYLKVRLVFDPPANSFVIQSIKEQIAEYEWRLNNRAEGGGTNGS